MIIISRGKKIHREHFNILVIITNENEAGRCPATCFVDKWISSGSLSLVPPHLESESRQLLTNRFEAGLRF